MVMNNRRLGCAVRHLSPLHFATTAPTVNNVRTPTLFLY